METAPKISDIKILINERPKENEDILAYANIVYGDIKLCGIAVRKNEDGSLRLCYPSKKKGDKQFWHYYPISVEANNELISEVEHKLRTVIGNADNRTK